MLCPVCLVPVADTGIGVTEQHRNTIGKICSMSGQPFYSWDEDGTRQAVANRSNGVCEFCRRAKATEKHHRKGRGVGGKWSPANILDMCGADHRFFTEHRTIGYQLGVLVYSGENPAEVPVTTRDGVVVYLSDDVAPPNRGEL